jgi:Cu+-exporting ATPase
MEMNTFHIKGMHCASCARAVERAAKSVQGVQNAEVNLATETVRIESKSSLTAGKRSALSKAVENAGFSLVEAENDAKSDRKSETDASKPEEDEHVRAAGRMFFFSAALSIPLLVLSMGPMIGLPIPVERFPLPNALIQAVLTLGVLFVGRGIYLGEYPPF